MKSKRLIIISIVAVVFISATAFMLVDSSTKNAPKPVATTVEDVQKTAGSETEISTTEISAETTTEAVIDTTVPETESKVTVTEKPDSSSGKEPTSPTNQAPATENHEEPTKNSGGTGMADINTGISWDGNPILYYYKDGTTGYEPKTGAEYELKPGIWAVVGNLNAPKDDGLCTNGCGRKRADCDSRLCDWHCDVCNVDVKEFECHPRH